ncbi:NAD-dependent succinate-semialdehyde dehydrogenase [Pseudolysinimonas kribbensis]|uniref:NAD-dependent succinate-semialdehyde dehydrogenase n=1 Tax=Pseudolysinimonas kribbensis TaxID=433641 RepID=A0ABQ6K7D5_9MICO|nr:NAD-dependent succinate-semialdehyde dehydrogenase [Pseudolysinimonas kribbensis]GMA95448.1 NAD-dependent succinate-semialdehyde dehydrogenase [Pseudolysinimonas kribbensis]
MGDTIRNPDGELFVDGRWIPSSARDGIDVEDPATRATVGRVAVATDDDVDAAIDAAGRTWREWRETSPHARTAIIMRAAQLLRDRAVPIAEAMTRENGKPYGDSLDEVAYTADIMDSLATDAPRRFGHVLPTAAADGRTMVVSEPVGPVAAFTTWNYPLTVPGRKVAAALAAGCTVVIKPAEETPASAVALAHALADAGLPDGVLNMVFGDPARISSRLIASPVMRKVSFTGSTAVGTLLARQAAEHAKPTMLELGGHAPVIVFDDVDVDAVAQQALGAKIHNTGQSCGSPIRFYVHENVYERFVERFGELLGGVSVADGFAEGVGMGPLANGRRFAAMEPIVRDAVSRGARLVTGGVGDDSVGYYWRPTLLADVPEDAVVMNEEPFGPIAAVSSFRDESDVIERANRLPFGLGAYLFTGSAERALRIPGRLDVGMVSVNRFGVGARDTFFGGRKESGYGSEGGPEAVEEYLVRKLIVQS